MGSIMLPRGCLIVIVPWSEIRGAATTSQVWGQLMKCRDAIFGPFSGACRLAQSRSIPKCLHVPSLQRLLSSPPRTAKVLARGELALLLPGCQLQPIALTDLRRSCNACPSVLPG